MKIFSSDLEIGRSVLTRVAFDANVQIARVYSAQCGFHKTQQHIVLMVRRQIAPAAEALPRTRSLFHLELRERGNF